VHAAGSSKNVCVSAMGQRGSVECIVGFPYFLLKPCDPPDVGKKQMSNSIRIANWSRADQPLSFHRRRPGLRDTTTRR
jgi:hypothetical protein